MSVTEKFENEDYTYLYNYDNFGRINKMTYPNGFEYTKHYKEDNGYLEKIMYNQESDLIWQVNEINAQGQITEFEKGNGLITYKSYDNISRCRYNILRIRCVFEYNKTNRC
ncbi:MAG: hypothetical protein GXO80_01430 [Chlorobi bacterium]|nr:hypothetical protein [Chlorobiota bacterium]